IAARTIREQGLGNARIFAWDITGAFPFPSGSFDAALFLDVIEHLVPRLDVLREIHRVLTEDGRLLVSGPNRETRWRRTLREAGRMSIGFLPALGSGIRSLAEAGQLSRLLDGYMRPYADAFGEVLYFSYLPESLEEFTSDPALLRRVRVFAPAQPMSRGRRALTMARAHADEFRRCRALRVFQITGTIPARRATKRFGVPYVTTYGFWYAQLSAPGLMGRLKRPLKARVGRQGCRDADAVIATTDELCAMASRFSSRVELIPNGVDTQLFAPAGTTPRSGPPRILYVGRLSTEKNLKTIVTATSYVGDGALDIMVGS